MGATPEDAYRLQEKAEHWQTLASRQQELAMGLRRLASEQRELVGSWEASNAEELTAEAKRLEDDLHTLAVRALGLERAALDGVARAIAEEVRALRPK